MEKIIELEHYESFKQFTSKVEPLTPQQLQIEFLFLWAEMITKNLLKDGVISRDEFHLIMAENLLSFPTYLSPLF